jgi:uncharacterized protein YecE (DUF72 family)
MQNRRTAGEIHVGCAGWNIPKQHSAFFDSAGSHLERYAQRFNAVEINSSFYRPHLPATYARWAAATPDDFWFSVKAPRTITHARRLANPAEPLDRFLGEVEQLGAKLGPLLIQLPPSLAFTSSVAGAFFTILRERFDGDVACEPRHPSWFSAEADRLLAEFRVAGVAADPAVARAAAVPSGWPGLAYYRLHGSPEMYESAYSADHLDTLARQIAELPTPSWCIFDNTALGAAMRNALELLERLEATHGLAGRSP